MRLCAKTSPFNNIDDFVKVQYLRLRAISQNFTYAKYSAFFEIAQALILNFLQSRRITTYYEFINIDGFVKNPISTKTGSGGAVYPISQSGIWMGRKTTPEAPICHVVIHGPALDKHNMTAS